MSLRANCVDVNDQRIIIIDSLEACIGLRQYALKTAWEALEQAAHESPNIHMARGHAAAWLASTAGVQMHVRIDDWRSRILSRSEREDAAELHRKAARLLTELANPDGYFRTQDDVLEARYAIVPQHLDDRQD